MDSSLGPASRAVAMRVTSSEVLDLLVVGAGATGTGTALDAASRGLSVGLIGKGDIAGGTSSKSSKLVHGGLRYLQQGNVALVRVAAGAEAAAHDAGTAPRAPAAVHVAATPACWPTWSTEG